MDNSNKIILDLCGGTGSWSKPYKDAGYDVRLITLPNYDVMNYSAPKNTYGILAAPPCTDFSIAGTQYWRAKDKSGSTAKSLQIVNACLRIISECDNLRFWALENPKGRLKNFIGEPKISYNYKDFGCIYSKTVCLWGEFNIFLADYIGVAIKDFDKLKIKDFGQIPKDYDIKGSKMRNKKAIARSITYSGFANKFYEFNK